MGKFKSKKRRSNLIIYIGLFLIGVSLSIRYLYKKDLIKDNTLIDTLISDNLGNYNKDLNNIDFLLKYALNINSYKESSKDKVVVKEEEKDINDNLPLVYIYNTHQSEKYTASLLEPWNIATDVLMASKMLKEYIEDEGIKVIVEEDSVIEKLHSLNLSYGSSYKVSRMFLENAKSKNNSLEYFIDLHRDSSVYKETTTNIDGNNYARLLFVVGLDNPNYSPNLALAENLRDRIKNYNENLFRGIMKKSGKGVNGVYNQDFSPKVMLIEVGGQYNSISEVNNTLKVLASILVDYIKEDLDE